jgi:hypothetical protein
MKLIVHELEVDGVEQKLTATKNVIVEAVRPHLYRHNFPTGSLKVEIYTLVQKHSSMVTFGSLLTHTLRRTRLTSSSW